MIGAATAPLIFCLAYFALLRVRGAPNRLRAGILWAGRCEFDLDDLKQADLASSIRIWGDRWFRWWTQGRGVVGGRLTVSVNDLVLALGYFARAGGATGTVDIPRSRIDSLEIGHLPGTVIGNSGGAISLILDDGARLDGRFLGSRPQLLEALRDFGGG
jgi:hypothetical protein